MENNSYRKESVVSALLPLISSKLREFPLIVSLALKMLYASEETRSGLLLDTGDLTIAQRRSRRVSTSRDAWALFLVMITILKAPVPRATVVSYVPLARRATLATLATNATSVLSHMPTFLFYSGF